MFGVPEPTQPDLFDFNKPEIRPTNNYPILRQAEAGGYEVAVCRWSLVPSWFRDKPLKEFRLTSFNTRIEEAATKASWKGPYARRHCLVPVATFWEWWGPHPCGDAKKKQRWEIQRADNYDLVFAGIWDRARTADGEIESFSILTRPAGDDLSVGHDREPVSLSPDLWRPWVDCQPVAGVFGPDVGGEDYAWPSSEKSTYRFTPAADIPDPPRKPKTAPALPGSLL